MRVIAFGCVESAGEVKETVSRASGVVIVDCSKPTRGLTKISKTWSTGVLCLVIVDYPVCNWKCGTDPAALVENWTLVG